MPAPAIFAKVGAVIGKAVAGTAKGLAAGAKAGAKATASGAKSGGKLTKSSTKVKNNIVKSNKRIGKIKKNRQRIKKSIKNEQQRLQKERSLERKRTSNKIPGSGILNNPVISGLKKFIYTLLFGLAITNIEKIMKTLEKVKEMIAGFVKFIAGIKNGIERVVSAFTADDARLDKEKENFEKGIGKMRDALNDIDTEKLEKSMKDAKTEYNELVKGSDLGKNDWRTTTDISTLETQIEQQKKTITSTNPFNYVKSIRVRNEYAKMNKRLESLKWLKEKNIDPNNLDDISLEQLQQRFNLQDVNLSKIQKKDNLTALNSSTDQNMVVVSKTIIKKEYVPVPYSA